MAGLYDTMRGPEWFGRAKAAMKAAEFAKRGATLQVMCDTPAKRARVIDFINIAMNVEPRRN